MKKLLLGMSVLLSFTILTSAAWGACHVVTPSGSGSKSGADWSNACAGFSGNCSASSGMVRGDSYYLGKGTYSSPTWSRSNSGTSTISVKAPTASDHCTDTGFNSSTHVGQALIQGSNIFDSDYWIIDGQYGTEFSKGSYGIKFQWTSGNTQDAVYCRNGCDHSTFRYIEIQGSNYTNSYCDEGFKVDGYNHSPNTSNILLQYFYGYQSSNIVKINSTSNVTVEHGVLDENYSNSNCHGENFAMNDDANLVVRYNKIKDCVGTACLATPCSSCGTSSLDFYGNMLYTTHAGPCSANGGGSGSPDCLSSIFRNLGNTFTSVKIYNNSVANFTGNLMSSGNNVDFWYNSAGTSSAEIRNNVFYNNGPVNLNSSTCSSNSYYNTTRNTTCTSDTTGLTGSPFIDPQADFHLTADTTTWTALSSPYNLDPDGDTRTTSRGAYQFGTGSGQNPNPPTGLAATVN